MNVSELIDRIVAAYPGASLEAMKTFKPVFYARLQKFEGDQLDDAATAVLGQFKPTARQPFPIPLHFEEYLPKASLNLPSEGPRLDFAAQREKRLKLMAVWKQRQYPRIVQARGKTIADACIWEADKLAQSRAWSPEPTDILLTTEQIQICEERAVSQLRIQTFGAVALRRVDGIAKEQAEWCRNCLRNGLDPKFEPAPWVKIGRPKPAKETKREEAA